uniref:Uncharacterized protein n=1 Tax=Glossina austeni TaxID=7395 RepID=A0A1A9URB2_GLOAU
MDINYLRQCSTRMWTRRYDYGYGYGLKVIVYQDGTYRSVSFITTISSETLNSNHNEGYSYNFIALVFSVKDIIVSSILETKEKMRRHPCINHHCAPFTYLKGMCPELEASGGVVSFLFPSAMCVDVAINEYL